MHSSSLMLRRFCCFSSAASTSSPSIPSTPLTFSSTKKPLVFLGSPKVSTTVLDALLNAASAPESLFEVAAIVTQPPSRRERGKKVMPSPLAEYALDRGFPSNLILTPERAGEYLAPGWSAYVFTANSVLGLVTISGLRIMVFQLGLLQSKDIFLSTFRALQPELCITAAYGNILPSKFLNVPPLGTVNIHPSLLPLYRGAAPVQRALQDGVRETGVSLAFTVRALDAGPVIASERLEIDDHIKAPDLLALLFSEGSKLLIRELPSLFDGSAKVKAQPQDDSKATLAPKITPEESWLSFDEEAFVLHNKIRAFAGWPGTRAKVVIIDKANGHRNILELKVITTRVSNDVANSMLIESDDITFVKGALVIPCGGHTALEVLEVQLPGKKVVNAAAFWNGLRGQKLKKL